MSKKIIKAEVSLPCEDLSFFKQLIKKMGWSLLTVSTDEIPLNEQSQEEYEVEETPLYLNITLTNYYNIRRGKKKIYRHSISDYDCAYKIFRHNYGKICINEKFKSINKEWTFTDHHNDQCPFIVRQYNKVVFKCEALDQKLETEIDGIIKVKYNSESNKWYFEFRIGEIKK